MIERRLVILDTNIIIKGFLFQHSDERAILRVQKKNNLTLAVSVPIVDEYVCVLLRLLEKHREDPSRVFKEFSRGMAAAYSVKIPKKLRHKKYIPEDSEDDKYLQCAIAGNIDLIVSNDHHLRDVDSIFRTPSGRSIRVMEAAEFALLALPQHREQY